MMRGPRTTGRLLEGIRPRRELWLMWLLVCNHHLGICRVRGQLASRGSTPPSTPPSGAWPHLGSGHSTEEAAWGGGFRGLELSARRTIQNILRALLKESTVEEMGRGRHRCCLCLSRLLRQPLAMYVCLKLKEKRIPLHGHNTSLVPA